MGGKKEHQSFDLKSETIYIGRDPENDIQIDDKYISRKHLKIQRKGDKYLIQDLNSKNGTFVNGKQISPNDLFELGEGQTIVIGMSVICLDQGSSAAAQRCRGGAPVRGSGPGVSHRLRPRQPVALRAAGR